MFLSYVLHSSLITHTTRTVKNLQYESPCSKLSNQRFPHLTNIRDLKLPCSRSRQFYLSQQTLQTLAALLTVLLQPSFKVAPDFAKTVGYRQLITGVE